MFFNFINYLYSWWNTMNMYIWWKPLLITENPITYLKRQFANTDGISQLYIKGNRMYFDVVPESYDLVFSVSIDMSNVEIDNNIAKIKYLFYDDIPPIWPHFNGKLPVVKWITSEVIYYNIL